MKNLQRLLLTAAFVSMMPSTSLFCSEKTTKRVENNILLNIAYFGAAGVLSGSASANALTYAKTNISNIYGCPTNPVQQSLMLQLTKKIKISRALMGISTVAVFAPIIIPAVVDKFNAINKRIEIQQNINKELTKETV